MRFGSIIDSMVIDMNETKLSTIAQLRGFLQGTCEVQFEHTGDDAERYAFIGAVIGASVTGACHGPTRVWCSPICCTPAVTLGRSFAGSSNGRFPGRPPR